MTFFKKGLIQDKEKELKAHLKTPQRPAEYDEAQKIYNACRRDLSNRLIDMTDSERELNQELVRKASHIMNSSDDALYLWQERRKSLYSDISELQKEVIAREEWKKRVLVQPLTWVKQEIGNDIGKYETFKKKAVTLETDMLNEISVIVEKIKQKRIDLENATEKRDILSTDREIYKLEIEKTNLVRFHSETKHQGYICTDEQIQNAKNDSSKHFNLAQNRLVSFFSEYEHNDNKLIELRGNAEVKGDINYKEIQKDLYKFKKDMEEYFNANAV